MNAHRVTLIVLDNFDQIEPSQVAAAITHHLRAANVKVVIGSVVAVKIASSCDSYCTCPPTWMIRDRDRDRNVSGHHPTCPAHQAWMESREAR